MSKNIAELVVKMKNETSLSVETMGDSTDQVFMAAIAVAHTVADASNGNRKKAEVVMTIAKAIIDERFESIWKREYGNAPATEPVATADTAEKRNDPSASQPGDVDSMMEKIIADAMKQAKENPGQAQGVMFKVPAGDMPMEEVVKHIISAVDKQTQAGFYVNPAASGVRAAWRCCNLNNGGNASLAAANSNNWVGNANWNGGAGVQLVHQKSSIIASCIPRLCAKIS